MFFLIYLRCNTFVKSSTHEEYYEQIRTLQHAFKMLDLNLDRVNIAENHHVSNIMIACIVYEKIEN